MEHCKLFGSRKQVSQSVVFVQSQPANLLIFSIGHCTRGKEHAVLSSSRRRPGHHGIRRRRREREPGRRGMAEPRAQVGGHRGHGRVVLRGGVHLAVVAGAGEVVAGRRGGSRGAVAEPGVEGLEEVLHAAGGAAPLELALSPRLKRQLPIPRLDGVLLERDWPGYLQCKGGEN